MTYTPLRPDPVAAVTNLMRAGTGLAVETSGSTGAPRTVLLSADAVLASARLTAARLGEAAWLLALPPERIGGAMVMVRARLADAPMATMPPGPFTPEAFTEAAAALDGEHRRHVSLVPTQLRRLLASATGRDALAAFDAVLVGGAAFAGDAPASIVTTYGMSETSGGCVYDGLALDGVQARVREDGRILLSGPTLADGYADGDGTAFETHHGTRWFVTSDVGELAGGRLTVLGRADHVINTGGVKVHPQAIESALESVAGITSVAAVGVPDAEWGEAVVAVIEGRGDDAAVAAALGSLPPYARPKRIVTVARIPRTAGGKIDRRAARALAAEEDR